VPHYISSDYFAPAAENYKVIYGRGFSGKNCSKAASRNDFASFFYRCHNKKPAEAGFLRLRSS
jgi:hypothetical protein